jgi:hypothetical protein
MSRKRAAERGKGFPSVAHQMGGWIDSLAENPVGLRFRQIAHHSSASLSGRSAFGQIVRPLNDGEGLSLSFRAYQIW